MIFLKLYIFESLALGITPHKCAPSPTLHRPAVECTLIGKNCNVIKDIIDPGTDKCQVSNPTCQYQRSGNEIVGSCHFLNDGQTCTDVTVQHQCIIDHAKECEKLSTAETCVQDPECFWRAQCEESQEYCRDNCSVATSGKKYICGTAHFDCDLLQHVDPDTLRCAHVARIDELDEYCITKSRSSLDRMVVSVVVPVLFIMSCLSILLIPNKGIYNHSWLLCIQAFGYSSLFCGSFVPTLALATDYADASGWKFSFDQYSPHWVLFVLFYLVVFFFYQVQHHMFYRQASPNAVLLSSALEFGVEVVSWGSLVGIQTSSIKVCLWAAIAAITSMVRLSQFAKHKKLLISMTITNSLLFPALVYITNYFILAPRSMTASCGWLTVLAVIQSVAGIWRLDDILHQATNHAWYMVAIIVCIASGITFPVIFFYETYTYTAWAEDYISSHSR